MNKAMSSYDPYSVKMFQLSVFVFTSTELYYCLKWIAKEKCGSVKPQYFSMVFDDKNPQIEAGADPKSHVEDLYNRPDCFPEPQGLNGLVMKSFGAVSMIVTCYIMYEGLSQGFKYLVM